MDPYSVTQVPSELFDHFAQILGPFFGWQGYLFVLFMVLVHVIQDSSAGQPD